jgi:predicted enzyme related to lactoylglutathione lyase
MGKKVVHVEFPADDLDRAQRFWEGVGGWSIRDSGMPGIDYRMYQEDDQGGALTGRGDMTQQVNIYFGSDDIDADLAKVGELGGEAGQKQPIPSIGWFAACKDTEGNAFSLFQSDESAQMPEGMEPPS